MLGTAQVGLAIVYPIDSLSLNFGSASERLPPPVELLDTAVELALVDGVYEVPDGAASGSIINLSNLPAGARFSDAALGRMLNAVVAQLNKADYYGVYVVTDQEQIDPRTGRDRRDAGDTSLTLDVYVGEIQDIQSVGKGGRIGEQRPIDHPYHSRILQHSPLKPLAPGDEPYLFRKEKLDDYLRRLNRHPGRRVDATIASSGEPGKIDLHYLVSENRPFFAYGQIANTGTESVGEWQYRAGVGHYQLTGVDDVFTFDYEASDPDSSFSMLMGYHFPVVFPDYLKLGFFASYSEFQGEQFGVGTILDFSGQSSMYGMELRYSPWSFLDFAHTYFLGIRSTKIEVTQQIFLGLDTENSVSSTLGEDELDYMYGGVEFTRFGNFMNTRFSLTVEGTLNKVDPDELDNLGRLDADRGWMLTEWAFDHSFYLEPVIFPQRFRDTEDWKTSTLANEIAFAVRGQYVLTDDRIIPQVQFVMGGFQSVRGYPESIAAADNGWFMQSEYRLHIPRLFKPYSVFPKEERPSPFRNRWNVHPPRPLVKPDWDFIVRAFTDYGQTENVEIESFETDQELWSAGLGFELQLGQSFTLRTDVGMVLNSADEFDSGSGDRSPIEGAQYEDVRAHFQFTYVW